MFMPKKLTILGALTVALVFGYLGLFNGSTTTQGAVQTFSPAAGYNWTTCYGGAYPVPDGSGGINCGAGSSTTNVPKNTAITSYTVIELPVGLRLSLPITYTPGAVTNQLNGAITAGATTIVVDSTTGFTSPAGRIRIDSEEMSYTGTTGTSFTGVTRGINATTAAAHADNAFVFQTTQWQAVTPTCGALDGNNECSAGTVAGDVTAKTDLGCNNPTFDILADTGPGGLPPDWPDNNPADPDADGYWTPPNFIRTSASPALGGGGEPTGGTNDYVTEIVPFPTDPPNAYTFSSIDTAALATLYIGGTGALPIPGGAVLLQLATYQSTIPGQAGLGVSVALLAGEPSNPPDDAGNCLDSPQDSASTVTYLKTPDADRVIPRWNATISAADDQDSSIDRILDWECIEVGDAGPVGPGDGDADDDCLDDASDPDTGDKDTDGDLVPDGVEAFANSDPNDTDTDNDGADDYEELFQFTDPHDTDSDHDGQADKLDDIPTNGTEGADATALTDDNCPAVDNGSQLNTDSLYQYHGMGAGTGDKSNPDEDTQGDACDTDDDNDGLNDVSEAGLTIQLWTGYTGAATTVCAGPGVGAAPDTVMSPIMGDVDMDYYLDGIECSQRSRPDQSVRGTGTGPGFALNCNIAGTPTAPIDEGCAQPGGSASGPGGSDVDADGLYLPGGGAGGHDEFETFWRTRQVNTGPSTQANDFELAQFGTVIPPDTSGCSTYNYVEGDGLLGDGDKDSDRDLFCPAAPTLLQARQASNLQDGVEAKFYGTEPSQFDTDQDGCPDAEEVDDMNGDGNTSSGDQLVFALRKATFGTALDNDADGKIDDYAAGTLADLNKDGQLSSGDQQLLAGAISAYRNCLSTGVGWEDNVDIGKATAGLP
jgi:hypothetical protein